MIVQLADNRDHCQIHERQAKFWKSQPKITVKCYIVCKLIFSAKHNLRSDTGSAEALRQLALITETFSGQNNIEKFRCAV